MIDIVFNGVEGKFIPNDEFLELQHLQEKQNILIEDLINSLKKN